MTMGTRALLWHPGRALRDIRKDVLKLSQEAFATHMEGIDGENWDQPKVSEIETGKRSPTYDEMTQWAEGLGFPLRFFTEGELPNRVKGLFRDLADNSYNQLPLPLLVA